jgi:hypothetical protein
MRYRTVLASVIAVAVLVLASAGGAGASLKTTKATCTVSDSTPEVGETVTFTATGLQGGGVTRLEIISATDGSYYYDLGTIGSASTYSYSWTFNEDGVFAAVFSRVNNGNVKCDAYVTVGSY